MPVAPRSSAGNGPVPRCNFPSALHYLGRRTITTSGALSRPCSVVLHDRSQQLSRDINMEDSSYGGPFSLDSASCLRPTGPLRPSSLTRFSLGGPPFWRTQISPSFATRDAHLTCVHADAHLTCIHANTRHTRKCLLHAQTLNSFSLCTRALSSSSHV